MPSTSRMVRSLEQAPIWEANACSVCPVRYHGWNAFRRTKSSGATTQPTYTVRHGQTIRCAPMPFPTPAKPRRLTQQPVHAPFSPSLAASRRHHQCPQPAARSPHYRPLPSPRKSTRYVVTRVAGRFEAQGPTETRPPSVVLLGACWTTIDGRYTV